MNDYPVTIEEIVSWLRFMESTRGGSDVTLAEVRERHTHVPAVAADFDSSRAIGRISAWVTGAIDFQVLRKENGEDVLFRHAQVSKMDGPDLEAAYADFLCLMLNPDSSVPVATGEKL